MSAPISTRLPVGNKDFTNATVIIIGAGISGMCPKQRSKICPAANSEQGMCMAIDLIKRNECRNFVILEKSSSVGGTWNDNKYPGCCCDGVCLQSAYSRHELMEPSLEHSVQLFIRAEPWMVTRISWTGGDSCMMKDPSTNPD
jgi:hypothetical protein